MIHYLKILPEYFIEVARGAKTFEVRKNDRPFNVGDELVLREVNCGRYTGQIIRTKITYILKNPDYCKEGYCVIGFKQLAKYSRWVPKGDGTYKAYCECCGHEQDPTTWNENYNYCPYCGAEMKGESICY